MKTKFTNVFLASLCLAMTVKSYAQTAPHDGGVGGGGGDVEEARVNEIRSDIKNWIEKGGAKGLKLSPGLSLEEYNSQILQFLQAKYVTVGFVVDDSSSNEELRVVVDGADEGAGDGVEEDQVAALAVGDRCRDGDDLLAHRQREARIDPLAVGEADGDVDEEARFAHGLDAPVEGSRPGDDANRCFVGGS